MDQESCSSSHHHSFNSFSQPRYPHSQSWSIPPPPQNVAGINYWMPPPPINARTYYNDANSDVPSSSEMLGAQTVTNAIANRYYTSNNSSSYGFRDQVSQRQPYSSSFGSYGRQYGEKSSAKFQRESEAEGKKSGREVDQEWVDAFVTNAVKASSSFSSSKMRNVFSVGNARLLMKKCICLINELKAIHSKLNSIDKSDDTLWNATADEAVDVKSRIEKMLDELKSTDKLTELKKKMKRIRKKRERLKRQRFLKSEEKKEKEKQNKLQHEKLDFWLQSIRQDYLNSEMEKKMKKEADGILSEVRRKKAEANRTMDLVKSLFKLRAVRKQMAVAKGLYSSSESDGKFTKSIALLENILKDRLSEYGDEERALQVILEEEHQETRDMQTKRQQLERDDKANTLMAEVLSSLFGPEVIIGEHDPRFRCWEYLTRSERDLSTLIHVRNEWDSWLANSESTLNGQFSSVPIGWIRPSDPSNEMWASMLSH